MMMFDKSLITTNKNLLAFSAGVDSSALFFILLEQNINFDIAIVDYNLREQSKQELAYAKDLAKKYNKKIYLKTYEDEIFSEKSARDFRYKFFDEIILNNNYDSLITAHQLNDKLEWFLMQFSKGAGLVELVGLQEYSKRKNYIVYKPLLEISKDELLEYLKTNNIRYYIDETNNENIYKRNYFRNTFANKFLDQYKDGIKKSFKYLKNDIESLDILEDELILDELKVMKFKNNDINLIIRYIDKELKKRGLIISSHTRVEIIRQKEIIISNKIAISIQNKKVYIAPYCKNSMDKKFKEFARVNKIPKNIRSYLVNKNIDKVKKIIEL